MQDRTAVYFSVDIEANGSVPGRHSMLSLGAVAFDADGNDTGRFSRNFRELNGASRDRRVMEWWANYPDQFHMTRLNTVAPHDAMNDFSDFISQQSTYSDRIICMAHPASYDFPWIDWYFKEFLGINPFGHICICIKTLVMAALKVNFLEARKRDFPQHWGSQNDSAHIAVEDALFQGRIAVKLMKDLDIPL